MSPVIVAALMHAALTQTYPDIADLTPFTQPANYMSLRGVLTLRYRQVGRWVTRAEAGRAVQSYLAARRYPAANEAAPFTRAANFMSLRGFEHLKR